MCMVRSKDGQRYVRLCAWYIDHFGTPQEAKAVDTNSTYRQSQYIYFNGDAPPTSPYEGEIWRHYDPAKADRVPGIILRGRAARCSRARCP
jgi:hypothetical protein